MPSREAIEVADLPEPLIRRVLLHSTGHDDLLRHVSACARVCADWRCIVGGSPAYGIHIRGIRGPMERIPRPLQPAARRSGRAVTTGSRAAPSAHCREPPPVQRARVLKLIGLALRRAQAAGGVLDFSPASERIGDEGGRTLAVALHALPPQAAVSAINVRDHSLTAEGLQQIVTAIRPSFAGHCLKVLDVGGNAELGDAGMVTLAALLPLTLESLQIDGTGCGDAGMEALAVALPTLMRFSHSNCGNNPAIGQRGWEALGVALKQMPALQQLELSGSAGMGNAGFTALAAGFGGAVALRSLHLSECNIGMPVVWSLAAVFAVSHVAWQAARAAISLAPMPGVATLETLDLEDNHIGDIAIAIMVEVLKRCSNLREVRLGGNLYTAVGQAALDSIDACLPGLEGEAPTMTIWHDHFSDDDANYDDDDDDDERG